MRTLASIFAAGALALALSGCGDSGNGELTTGTGGATGGTGSTTGNGGSTSTAPVYSLGNGTGAGFQTGMIGLTSSTLSAGGSTSLTVNIVDQTGTPYTSATPTTITFNSTCMSQGLATIVASGTSGSGTAAGMITTTNGTGSATYAAKGCSGADVVTASAVVGTATLTATGTVNVAAANIGSIQFVSATPQVVGLKGTGLGETSTVVFKVVDSTGGARPNAAVTFSLNTTVGGMSISPTSATSGADGTVQTVVSAGTVHTSVRVTATIASPALSTQSSVLTVTTGLPASRGFSLAVGAPTYGTGPSNLACPNVEAYTQDLIPVPITTQLADRYNNPAPDGTAVSFTTDGGHIVGSCTTPLAVPGDGACKVTWTSANPRPQLNFDTPPLLAAGRVTILATAIGEESFTDVNGSGFWQTGDAFDDLGEPYRDDNENGHYDSGEYFLDYNQNGKRDSGTGSFVGITCSGTAAGSTCSTSTLAISVSATIIMSTGGAQITSNTVAGQVTHGATTALTFNVQDQNGNPMAAGTTVTVTADAGVGTISPATASFILGCQGNVGGTNFTSTVIGAASPGSGNVTIIVVSPGTKSQTILSIPFTNN
ncbi:MAG: hypothetical protein JWL65_2752 [Gammaproteobacteria bacterium]|nr:hypothetical protein [Gammaproteobacteria bacterium]